MTAERIAARAAREVREGMVINLGIGLPTRVLKYLPSDQGVMIHSENGILGVSAAVSGHNIDHDLIDAGGAILRCGKARRSWTVPCHSRSSGAADRSRDARRI
jgi:acyl CoA:acetate/3-ketoacid CoA transferase beta subunit